MVLSTSPTKVDDEDGTRRHRQTQSQGEGSIHVSSSDLGDPLLYEQMGKTSKDRTEMFLTEPNVRGVDGWVSR